jgi:hypothetical protein
VPNRNYARGADLERQWCEDKRRDGWVAGRMAGSHGPFDGFAAREFVPGVSELLLAQMKSGGTHTFDGFGPSARKALREAAEAAGGRAVLVRKRTRERGYTEHYEDEWPD